MGRVWKEEKARRKFEKDKEQNDEIVPPN